MKLFLISVFIVLGAAIPALGQSAKQTPKTYDFSTWDYEMCRAKGRFQDLEYCSQKVVDQIVADGKPAIPVLISQITDPRWLKEPVFDYWPRIRRGELAHFILSDLFLDDTWEHSTMPDLFPDAHCDSHTPASACWAKFRETHSLKEIQSRWMKFWKANRDRIYWDAKARCFRLSKR
ncbi:MAG: hypothetical protein ACM3NO_01740 [Deltaproteobacteria bacterium]